MRRRIEVLLRTVAFGALLLAFVLMVTTMDPSLTRAPFRLSRAVFADSSPTALVRVLSDVFVSSNGDTVPWVHADLVAVPSADARGALRAAGVAGMRVTWNDSTGAKGLAVLANALPDPQGGTLVRAYSAPSPVALVIRDAGGMLDSASSGFLAVRAARLSTTVWAQRGDSRASIGVPAAPTLQHALVLARAGWEAKLSMAALEERGWVIDARLQLSPSTFVNVGHAATPDTARYAVVFVLDSGVVTRAVLARYLRQGGGVVFVGDALVDVSLASLLPARVGSLRAGVAGALRTTSPRDGLAFRRLAPTARAVVLQYDGIGNARTPAMVARRYGAGRSVATGYRESWRWRMEGNDDGIDAHRAWWTALASAAAFVPRPAFSVDSSPTTVFPGDAAPYADLVARLGAPTTQPVAMIPRPPAHSRRWLLFMVAASALLAEWGSRRTRGAP